ncbi:unnamed protein product [Linum tenue]|uniref:TIR domain-containing protein n=1 Tax=Linum tenue TaxID=586396 RepID=A0AAV0K8I0_9ROSI|nr:unnamed protein product [Linum tenue]
MPPFTYHVFLSFRGKDTRRNFTDHLHRALKQEGFHTFKDDNDINRGKNIGEETKQAIRQSRVSIIVFSKDYTSSFWCLDELAMIMEEHRRSAPYHVVVPVYYDVNPADLAKQMGSCFAKGSAEMEIVGVWKEALLQSDECSSASNGVLAVIYGIGGVGKTTIAKAVYNLSFDKFDGSSFLANVKEASEQHNGLVHLQRQLVMDVSGNEGGDVKINRFNNLHEGIQHVRDAICFKRVLLVLDDVDEVDQLDAILGARDCCCRGSKIIVTTRHESLFRRSDMTTKFRVEPLDETNSLELFSWHAFGQHHPLRSHVKHSKSVANYCQGLPLALEVLGSSLANKSIELWESALEEMETIPPRKVLKILKISYDSLENDHHRRVFLDVACFFVGMKKDYVVNILNGFEISAAYTIQSLMDRYLVTVDEDRRVRMHQLVRDMGRAIVFDESENPGERSRLWRQKDAIEALRESTGTERVRGLSLNLEEHGHGSPDEDSSRKCLLRLFRWCRKADGSRKLPDGMMKFQTKALAKMSRLRLLKLGHVKLKGEEYRDLPRSLIWLFWRGFPLTSIPQAWHLEKLVVLDMRHSCLKFAWKGLKFLRELKILNLSHSHDLVRTPDFLSLPSLEKVVLKGCIRLLEINKSIVHLKKLAVLNLKNCMSLRRLPNNFELLSLEKLVLSGCTNLDLPIKPWKMESLKSLHMDGVAVNQSHKKKLTTFSVSVLPYSLVSLSLSNCNIYDNTIPKDLKCLPCLKTLNLSKNPIRQLPETFANLSVLESLDLSGCNSLIWLPELPRSLEKLNVFHCNLLRRLTNLPNFYNLLLLSIIYCNELVEIQGIFKLEPAGEDAIELINQSGLYHLESADKILVTLINMLTSTTMKASSLQILHECGISNLYLPGRELPSWFHHQKEGSILQFQVHVVPGHELCGLNLCVIYGYDDSKPSREISVDRDWIEFVARITNQTKGEKWVYYPIILGIPEGNNEMLWLSHWKFDKGLIGSGDKVDVSVQARPLVVRRCGVHLMYRKVSMTHVKLGSEKGASLEEMTISDYAKATGKIKPGCNLLNNYVYSGCSMFYIEEEEGEPKKHLFYEAHFFS